MARCTRDDGDAICVRRDAPHACGAGRPSRMPRCQRARRDAPPTSPATRPAPTSRDRSTISRRCSSSFAVARRVCKAICSPPMSRAPTRGRRACSAIPCSTRRGARSRSARRTRRTSRSPLTNVPSYSRRRSATRFPLGKRGPRRERGDALAEGAGHVAEASAREQALDFARLLGRIAVTRLRDRRPARPRRAAARACSSSRARRLAQGFGTPLDIDRLEIELSRSEQQVLVTEAEEQAGLTACAALRRRAMPGDRLGGGRARAHRRVGQARDAKARRTSRRAPMSARSTRSSAPRSPRPSLARAQAIPDPTVRLGYTYDQFTVSGNQANSLNVSLTVPVTIFDHGQAQLQAAEARRARLQSQRALDASLERHAHRLAPRAAPPAAEAARGDREDAPARARRARRSRSVPRTGGSFPSPTSSRRAARSTSCSSRRPTATAIRSKPRSI